MAFLGKSLWGLARRLSGDLLPKFGDQYDLGSAALRFRNLFLYGTVSTVGNISTNGNIAAGGSLQSGAGIKLVEGLHFGTGAMGAGVLSVATTALTANSKVLYSRQVLGVGGVGHLSLFNITPGLGFQIISSDATEMSDITWTIIEPA